MYIYICPTELILLWAKCVPRLEKYLEYNVIIKDLEDDPWANLLPGQLPGPLPPHPYPIIILQSQTG